MNKHIEHLIDVYLDGELPSQQVHKFEAHTATCKTCRNALLARQQLSALIRDVPVVDISRTSVEFADDILDALDGGYAQTVPWWFELRGLYAEIRTWMLDLRVQQVGWVSVPIMLLLASVFIRSVGILNTIFSLVPGSDALLGQVFDFLTPASFVQVDRFWGGALGQMISFDIGDWTLFTGLFASLLIGFLYVAWIAGWLSGQPEADPVKVRD
jgi:hypothetical protein